MRLAQQNAVTSLKEECTRQMLAAAHTLALDSKNLLDAVDQARVRANLAQPRRISQDRAEEKEKEGKQEQCDAWMVLDNEETVFFVHPTSAMYKRFLLVFFFPCCDCRYTVKE